ncbi:hypothetical protein [Streptomyces sp. MAI_2237]
MAVASIAAGHGLETAATTRRPDRADALTAAGVDHVVLDDGEPPAKGLHEIWPEGPDLVLDLTSPPPTATWRTTGPRGSS